MIGEYNLWAQGKLECGVWCWQVVVRGYAFSFLDRVAPYRKSC